MLRGQPQFFTFDDSESKGLEAKALDFHELKETLSPLIRENVNEDSLLLDYGRERPDFYPFDMYQAYEMRINSFINGALYALKLMPRSKERDHRINLLYQLRNRKIHEIKDFKNATHGKPAQFKAELQHFYYHDLPQVTGMNPKELSLAEAFYVWQEVDRSQRRCRQVKDLGLQGTLIIEEIDTPRAAPLTAGQKAELLQIHRIRKPHWFQALPAWAKQALLDIVPQVDEPHAWFQYQRCRPATLRHIPGEANSSTHEIRITHLDEEGEIVSRASYPMERQGTPSSYEMNNKNERQVSANENLKQLLDLKLPQQRAKFEAVWGVNPAQVNLGIPVLLMSLLTPSHQAGLLSKILDFTKASGKENNTQLYREKLQAATNYPVGNPLFKAHYGDRNNNPYSCHPFTLESANDQTQFPTFVLNVPANAKLSNPIQPQAEYLRFIDEFCQKMEPQIQLQKQIAAERKDIIDQRLTNLEMLKSIRAQLQNLGSQKEKGRNRNLYLASLYDLSTRLMGGLPIIHCKSSKDRLAILLITSATILKACAEQRAQEKPLRIPAYTDQGPERERYVDIFCEFYTGGHQFLMAHDNSPGAPGIKNESLLDKDIIAKLQSMRNPDSPINLKSAKPDKKDPHGVYAQSKQAADSNKPGSFWQQHRKKILRYSILASIVILTLLGVALTLSGVLSPVGIIGLAAAANLGAAAIPLGLAANFSIFILGGALLSTLACKLGDAWHALRNAKLSFKSQIETLTKRNPNSPSPEPDTGVSINAKPKKFNTWGIFSKALPHAPGHLQPLIIESQREEKKSSPDSIKFTFCETKDAAKTTAAHGHDSPTPRK